MLKRKRRKGFWWYSWILVLLTAGGGVGGFYYGNHLWEKGPKEYRAKAVYSAEVRKAYSATTSETAEGVRDPGEIEVLKSLRGTETMSPVMRDLNLPNRWVLSDEDTLQLMANSTQTSLSNGELIVSVTRPEPQESAVLANAIAQQAAETLKNYTEKQKAEGLQALDRALEKARGPLNDALTKANEALRAADIPLTATAETSLTPYMEIEEVLKAKVDIDAAKEAVRQIELEQAAERKHWAQPLLPPSLSSEAVPPATFSGPDKTPLQRDWILKGLVVGIAAGLLLMLLLWKLFSPRRL